MSEESLGALTLENASSGDMVSHLGKAALLLCSRVSSGGAGGEGDEDRLIV